MLSKPIFKNHFHVEISQTEEIVYLLSEKKHYFLKGYVYRILAPFLDGTHTVDEIAASLELFFPRERILKVLMHLQNSGYIEDANSSMDPSTAAFWNLNGFTCDKVDSSLAQTIVNVVSMGSIDDTLIIEKLQSLGVQTSSDGEITLVLTNNYLDPALSHINQAQLRDQRPWLLVKPVGGVIWIGPLFIPGETGCFQCLSHRLKGNKEVENALQQFNRPSQALPVSRAVLPTTLDTGLSLAATQLALSVIDPKTSPLKGKMVTIDLSTLISETHVLSKRPQCFHCGDPEIKTPQPIILKPRTKTFTEDGGHRICTPSETLRKFNHLISPITGIVSELKPIFTDDTGIVSIYCGGYEIPVKSQKLQDLNQSLRSKATGKGKSELQSRASAFSEAIERYSATFRGNGYCLQKSLNQMNNNAIPIEHCMLFSRHQYQNRLEWNQSHLFLNYVPVPYDPDRMIDWTPVWSLTEETMKYVPTAYCYIGYNDPKDTLEPYFCVDTNGLAAGNVIEEAILQGFLELIERDAVSIWWYNQLNRPGVDLDNFEDPYFNALKQYYTRIGREFWVIDVTCDTMIPTFVAVSRQLDSNQENITLGCGSHFDTAIALSRALTEMNQALYLLEYGRTLENSISSREHFMKEWNQTATIEKHPYLMPSSKLTPTVKTTYPYQFNNNLIDDINQCLNLVKKLNLELLVHDLTLPDIKMSVVKVIVPGFRSFRAQFAPGRLYDVPVDMGWLPKPLEESQMNPILWWL
jgi:oxazoline/thiazoline synthase